jgi:hypothetical protein
MPVSTGRVSSLPRQVCGGRWCVAGTRGPKWPEDPTIRVTTPLKPAEPEKSSISMTIAFARPPCGPATGLATEQSSAGNSSRDCLPRPCSSARPLPDDRNAREAGVCRERFGL